MEVQSHSALIHHKVTKIFPSTKMTRKEFDKYCKIKEQEMKKTVEIRLPKILGPLAKSHFQEGFREGGFINASLEKWKPVQRSGSGAAAQYGPLLSGRNNLYNSVTYIPSRGRVTITNLVPYAGIHNSVGTLRPSVTDRMRRFAWRRYYDFGGGQKKTTGMDDPPEALRWKALALTPKTRLNIKSCECHYQINECKNIETTGICLIFAGGMEREG